MTSPDWRPEILAVLARGPTTSLGAAEAVGLSRPYVSRLLERMEREGAVASWKVSRARVWALPADRPKDKRRTNDEEVAELLIRRRRATASEIRSITGMPKTTLDAVLVRLRRDGRARRHRGRWYPNPPQ